MQAPEIEQELNEIRERLKHTESQLARERKARKMLQQQVLVKLIRALVKVEHRAR